ncbi:somatic embryogenesis receptor kinase 1 [Vigna unguiculata]|uniref:Somatic embryogenesis receptor kinase 1 n=1 Tax=Vigna unguiculata TaxID=3917 RepID=A0A4D6NMF4_VIGUN|nr:somatic embryogenesis receptor kinase 1 [Vigna unguiculata]
MHAMCLNGDEMHAYSLKGPSVCNYTGVYCAPSVDDPKERVVAGIDLNFGDIAGFLPDEIGLLSDLALLHISNNRFCGILPMSLTNLTLLYELDISSNRRNCLPEKPLQRSQKECSAILEHPVDCSELCCVVGSNVSAGSVAVPPAAVPSAMPVSAPLLAPSHP